MSPASRWGRERPQPPAGFAGLLLAALLGTGCDAPPSNDSAHVATEDMSVTADATNDGVETVARIRIQGPRGDVRLTGGDRLRLFAGGVSHDLRETQGEGGSILHEARFGDVDGAYEVRIVRPHDIGAEGLFFTMPPSFTLAGPDAVTDPIPLVWDAGDGDYDVALAIEGPCIQRFSRPLAEDTGAYAVQPAELVRTSQGACTLAVTVQRTSTAEMPVVFRAGARSFRATAVERRTIEVELPP